MSKTYCIIGKLLVFCVNYSGSCHPTPWWSLQQSRKAQWSDVGSQTPWSYQGESIYGTSCGSPDLSFRHWISGCHDAWWIAHECFPAPGTDHWSPRCSCPHYSAHLHSLRFLHLETTTLFQSQQDGASQSGRITYDRVTISIQASRIRTRTCTQWCSLGAKTQTIFSKVSEKSNLRYLTVLSLTPFKVGILTVVCRAGNPCWAFRYLNTHSKNLRRISWYSASQVSSLRRWTISPF